MLPERNKHICTATSIMINPRPDISHVANISKLSEDDHVTIIPARSESLQPVRTASLVVDEM